MLTENAQYNLLALDTSTPACSVALSYRGCRYSKWSMAARSHTQLILPMVDEVLDEAGVTLADLDGLAFTTGPGSFTGIRIGFGVAQGLAYGASLPVVPISTLQAMAHGNLSTCALDSETWVMPMLDARMDELYWALFKFSQGVLERVTEDSLTSPEDIDLDIPGDKTLLVFGDGLNYKDRFLFAPKHCIAPEFSTTQKDAQHYPNANSVLELAQPAFKAGKEKAIDEIQPHYLRDKVTWKKRKRLRGS